MNTTKKCSKTLQKKSAFSRFVRICKRIYWGRVAVAVLAIIGAVYLCILLIGAVATDEPTEAETATVEEEPENVQSEIEIWKPRYKLTEAERWTVASVVTAEAGGEPFAGKMAVAQCILQACEDDGIRPTEAVVKYKYAKSRPEPTWQALAAVESVFDLGEVVTSEPIKYFYAPALVYSEWHEKQDYVVTIQGHRFFKEAE